MNNFCIYFLIVLTGFQTIFAEMTVSIVAPDLAETKNISSATFHIWLPVSVSASEVKAVVVLCPGQNASGEEFFLTDQWTRFAAAHQFAVVGVGLTSDDSILLEGGGYFDAEKSGAAGLLKRALAVSGLDGKPLLIYGISGGARFAASFVLNNPSRVAAWSVYTTTKWPDIHPPCAAMPLGIVSCGAIDHQRLAPTLAFFQKLRKADWPVAWVRIEHRGHQADLELEEFTRNFFAASLRTRAPVVLDNTTKRIIPDTACKRETIVYSVLPCASLAESWRSLHSP